MRIRRSGRGSRGLPYMFLTSMFITTETVYCQLGKANGLMGA